MKKRSLDGFFRIEYLKKMIFGLFADFLEIGLIKMNQYICKDFYYIELLNAFGKWRKSLVNLHTQLTEIIRSTPLYPFSHLYIGGNQSLLYPLCHRIMVHNDTFNILFTISHYRVCGSHVGCYPQLAPLPRRYVYSMGVKEKNYRNYVRLVQAVNKNRNLPFKLG